MSFLWRRKGSLAIAGGGLAAMMVIAASTADAQPSSWFVIDGNARNGVTNTPPPYDWGNHGTAYDNTSCANGGINATDTAGTLGSGGIFNCGKQATPTASNPNPVPIAPTLTPAAAADSSIVASAFLVDPLFNSNNKNTGLTCEVTGVPTTSGDPSVLTTGASKNDLPLNGFVYLPGSLQPKDDLGNVYAVAHRTPSVNEVFFGAERVVNNGASHVDFEFLQSPVSVVPSSPTSCSGNLNGHRTGGDFLAAVDFGTGGSLAGFTIYEWSCGGTATTISPGTVCDPGTAQFPSAEYIPAPSPQSGAFSLAVNANGPIPCGGWVCRGQAKGDDIHTVATNEFMEGGVNLAELGFQGCVSTFLPHTRSSPDINSTLQDFAGPVGFNTCSITTKPAHAVTDIRSGGLTDSAIVAGFIGKPGTVDFKLYGPFASGAAITATSCGSANLVFDSGPVSTTSTGSPANYFATSGAPPGVGVYQWVASYTSPGGGVGVSGVCGDPTEQTTVVDANIQISPLTKTNAVGTQHVLTAHVNVSSGTSYTNAPAGTVINFIVTNSHGATATPPTGSCSTVGTTGSCTFTITSPTPGMDLIQASTSVSVDGLTLNRATGDLGAGDSANALKTWVDANVGVTPLTAANEVGKNHQVTATVKINDGTGTGYVSAPSGTLVTFSLLNSNGATATFVGGVNTCTTSGGSCSVTINSPTSGQVTINATTNVSVGGLTLTRSTGDTNAGDSGPALKTYVNASLSIAPPTANNEINHNHVITAVVTSDVGDGKGLQPTAGVAVNFSLTNSLGATSAFVGSSSCTTGALGTCTVTISSPTSGQTAIHATFTTLVNGVSITRSTGDGLSGDSGDASKTWVNAYITLALQHTPDPVGTPENVTATVFSNDGSGAGYKTVSGATVTLSIIGTSVGNFVPIGSTASCVTGLSGSCTVQIISNVQGTTTVHATTTITVNGVPITRSTGDGISLDSGDVVKTWQPITPNLATIQSAGGTVGSTSLTDTASVTGAFGAAGASDLITFKLYGPFATSAGVSCTGTPVFIEANDQLTGGTAGTGSQTWTVTTSGSFKPTLAGFYAWQVRANFAGDQSNTDPVPNPTACTSEVVQITPVNPTLATVASSPAGFLVNTTGTVSDTGTLSGFVNLQSGDTMTFTLFGPVATGGSCTTAVLGPFTEAVNTTTGAATTGNQSFTPTTPGTYYWVASFSGDVNNTTLNATNIGCGDSHEAVVVIAPSAQITPTNTTCQQFVAGTASTLSNFTYSGDTTIGTDQPGVFFYYDRFTLQTGSNTITVNEIVKSGQAASYLLHILNDDTKQVLLFDNNCNPVTATVTLTPVGNTYVVTITANITGTPAPFYVVSAKYTPKTIVGQPLPSPTTLDYQFSTTVNGTPVAASTQDILGIKV